MDNRGGKREGEREDKKTCSSNLNESSYRHKVHIHMCMHAYIYIFAQ